MSEYREGTWATVEQERREYQRHATTLRVQMFRSDTKPLSARTASLSLGGLHIECDRHQAQLIAPPGGSGQPAAGRQFTVRILSVPNQSESKTLTVTTDVTEIVPLADDVYRVGLRIDRFYGKSRQVLEDYLNSLRQAEE